MTNVSSSAPRAMTCLLVLPPLFAAAAAAAFLAGGVPRHVASVSCLWLALAFVLGWLDRAGSGALAGAVGNAIAIAVYYLVKGLFGSFDFLDAALWSVLGVSAGACFGWAGHQLRHRAAWPLAMLAVACLLEEALWIVLLSLKVPLQGEQWPPLASSVVLIGGGIALLGAWVVHRRVVHSAATDLVAEPTLVVTPAPADERLPATVSGATPPRTRRERKLAAKD